MSSKSLLELLDLFGVSYDTAIPQEVFEKLCLEKARQDELCPPVPLHDLHRVSACWHYEGPGILGSLLCLNEYTLKLAFLIDLVEETNLAKHIYSVISRRLSKGNS